MQLLLASQSSQPCSLDPISSNCPDWEFRALGKCWRCTPLEQELWTARRRVGQQVRDRGDLQRRQLPKTWPFQVGKREAQHRRESVPASRGLSNFPLQSGRTGLGCSVSMLASGSPQQNTQMFLTYLRHYDLLIRTDDNFRHFLKVLKFLHIAPLKTQDLNHFSVFFFSHRSNLPECLFSEVLLQLTGESER